MSAFGKAEIVINKELKTVKVTSDTLYTEIGKLITEHGENLSLHDLVGENNFSEQARLIKAGLRKILIYMVVTAEIDKTGGGPAW